MDQVTIVLNKAALEALFPEGSSQRLKLAESAVKAVVGQTLNAAKLSDEMRVYIGQAANRIRDEVLRSLELRRGWSDGLTEDFKNKIRAEVDSHVVSVIQTLSSQAVGNLALGIEERVAAAVDRRINSEITRAIGEKLSAAISAALAVQGSGGL